VRYAYILSVYFRPLGQPYWYAKLFFVELHEVASEREKLILVLKARPAPSPVGIRHHHNRSAFSTFADFEDAFRERFALSHANKQTLIHWFERFKQRDQYAVTRFHTAFLALAEGVALVNEAITPRQLRSRFFSDVNLDTKTCVTDTLVTTPAITTKPTRAASSLV
jgi:hypothetical protein